MKKEELTKGEEQFLEICPPDGHCILEFSEISQGLRLLREKIKEKLARCENALALFERMELKGEDREENP